MNNQRQINKVLAAAVILCVLAVAWFYGGNHHSNKSSAPYHKPASVMKAGASESSSLRAHSQAQEKAVGSQAHSDNPAKIESVSAARFVLADHEKTVDQYQTDPVTPGKPEPVEPQNAQVTEKKCTCTLSVECTTILRNMKDFNQDKLEVLPQDGVIFPATKVTFYAGESVFNVLQREMKKAGIQMEFEATPIYNSNYIEGINNIYEFDCGELSGWMYRVNGWFPNYGCSRYELKDGDTVEWVYTCDLGRDIGRDYAANGGGKR